MAKKIQRYSKYSLKVLRHTYKNVSIDTYILGNGPKKVFVFLPIPHSGLITMRLFDEEILKKVTLISFDIPGWASNQKTYQMALPISFFTNLTKSVAEYLNIKKYSVLGIQYGAQIATRISSTEDCIDSVVLIDPIFKKTVLKGKYKTYGLISRNLKLGKLVKQYTLFNLRRKKKYLINNIFEETVLKSYTQVMRNSSSKVISESIYEYYNADLSLHLSRLTQTKLLILYNKELEYQVEFLRRSIGREYIESYTYEKGEYPFYIDESSKRRVVKYLLDF